MLQKKYFDFKDGLNENVQQAKVYMKNRARAQKQEQFKSENPDATEEQLRGISLDAKEQADAERNPLFQKVKNTVTSNDNYTFLMTKIFFEDFGGDEQQLQELKNLYDNIKRDGLPKNIEMYVNPERFLKGKIDDKEYKDFTTRGDGSKKSISEMISDDLDKLGGEKSFKQFTDEFPAWQNTLLKSANKQQIQKLKEVADEFTRMGVDDDGNFDSNLNKTYKRDFFSKLKDFKTIDQIIDAAKAKIKSANNGKFGVLIKKIQKVNAQFGEINGAKVVYEENGYLVIEVFSYIANVELNSHTKHCIARSPFHWNSYLRDFNKQYYVYNFNVDETDNYSVIGMTIEPNGTIGASHLKDDKNCLGDFKKIIKDYGIPLSVFAPMSKEEVEIKKKRIEASKKIVAPDLTVELAEECLENGADPNAEGGIPLKNAVKSDNKELVSLLLKKGAMVNLTLDENSPTAISFAKDLDMIKLLVDNGASLNSKIFKSAACTEVKTGFFKITNIDVLEYLLESGMDHSFEIFYPCRTAAQSGDIKSMELLLKYADNIPGDKSIAEKQLDMISARRNFGLKNAAERLYVDATIFILDKYIELGHYSTKDIESFKSFVKALFVEYVQDSDKSDNKDKPEFMNTINNWVDNKFGVKKESNRFRMFKSFRY
jgi:hypothetical protein